MSFDHELIVRIVSGDVDAAEQFVDRYSRFIYSILVRDLRLPQDHAEDVFQNVFERMWKDNYRCLRRWGGRGSFASYLAVIVRNLSYDYLRVHPVAGAETSEDPDDDPMEREDDDPAAIDVVHSREVRAALTEAMTQLQPRDREILQRRHIEDECYRDIAEAMGLTVNQVGVYLMRAEQRLRNILRNRYPDLFDDDVCIP